MLGSDVLDVVIGMIFVYLLLSLLCSAVNEYIEAKLNYRSKNLWRGIQLLLNGVIEKNEKKEDKKLKLKARGNNAAQNAGGVAGGQASGSAQPGGAGAGQKQPPVNTAQEQPPLDLATELYNHGMIRALFQSENKLPSYIPSRTFALAVWNLASREIEKAAKEAGNVVAANTAGGAAQQLSVVKQLFDAKLLEDTIRKTNLAPQLKDSLITMIEEAKGDFDRTVKNIEDWYDSAMDRVSGWYKRHVQWILLVIGFLVAITINADSVNIARALIQDKTLRDVIVASATEYAKKEQGGSGASTETKKGGGDSNAADANSPNSHASTSNSSGTGSTSTNAGHEHATKTGSGNTNSANANSNGSNTNAGGSGPAGNANSHQSNSNDPGATGGAGATPSPTPAPNPIQQAYDKVNALGLPIGWAFDKSYKVDPRGVPQWKKDDWTAGDFKNVSGWLILKLFGLFLTGLAISQGAPFWFDLLNKFMVIRSTVKPKEKSREEASKDKTS